MLDTSSLATSPAYTCSDVFWDVFHAFVFWVLNLIYNSFIKKKKGGAGAIREKAQAPSTHSLSDNRTSCGERRGPGGSHAPSSRLYFFESPFVPIRDPWRPSAHVGVKIIRERPSFESDPAMMTKRIFCGRCYSMHRQLFLGLSCHHQQPPRGVNLSWIDPVPFIRAPSGSGRETVRSE